MHQYMTCHTAYSQDVCTNNNHKTECKQHSHLHLCMYFNNAQVSLQLPGALVHSMCFLQASKSLVCRACEQCLNNRQHDALESVRARMGTICSMEIECSVTISSARWLHAHRCSISVACTARCAVLAHGLQFLN